MRVLNLQALRGVACLLVFVFHIRCWEIRAGATVAQPLLGPLQYFGFAGVDLFFVLSGFVITWVNAAGLGDRGRLPSYVGRRLWRIYPVYWVCWCAAVPLYLAMFASEARHALTARQVVRYLLLLPTPEMNFFTPQSWTLTFEVGFYIAFALFFLMPRRAFLPLLGLWFVTVAGLIAVPAAGWLRSGLATRLILNPIVLEFLLGCLVAIAIRRGWTGWGRSVLAAGIAGFVVGGLATYGGAPVLGGRLEFRTALFGVPSALIVYGAIAVERVRGWVLPRWLQSVGDASYSIYLVHYVVFDVTAWLLDGLSHNLAMHLLRIGVMAVAGLTVGFLVHFGIERPLLALVQRRRSVTPPTPGLRRAA
jgi:exopolysaccharide production protein ExoZ